MTDSIKDRIAGLQTLVRKLETQEALAQDRLVRATSQVDEALAKIVAMGVSAEELDDKLTLAEQQLDMTVRDAAENIAQVDTVIKQLMAGVAVSEEEIAAAKKAVANMSTLVVPAMNLIAKTQETLALPPKDVTPVEEVEEPVAEVVEVTPEAEPVEEEPEKEPEDELVELAELEAEEMTEEELNEESASVVEEPPAPVIVLPGHPEIVPAVNLTAKFQEKLAARDKAAKAAKVGEKKATKKKAAKKKATKKTPVAEETEPVVEEAGESKEEFDFDASDLMDL